jgi:uncharacterized protein YqjF (DUF2071 family)
MTVEQRREPSAAVADMSSQRARQGVRYRSIESTRPARRPSSKPATGRPVRACRQDGSLERWLSERYCLYVVDDRGRALRADIHHSPGPLQPAAATIDANTMAAPQGIALQSDPLLHYRARQDVLIWPLEPA